MVGKNGKHPDKALSAVLIRHLIEPGYYADGNSLYLQVSESGSKSWIVRTTIAGRRCEIGVGSYKYMTLADARDEAIKIRKSARNGGDPLADKRALKQQQRQKQAEEKRPTFETVARLVHGEQSKAFRNPKHAAQWLVSLERFVFPRIGSKRIDRIESDDVMRILSPIWLEVPETSSRIKQRLKLIFDWAKAHRYRTGDNPTEGISKLLPKHNGEDQHFASLAYQDVPAFIHTLRKDEGISGRLAFEFLILTASRTNEIIKAKWTEIDLKTRIWTRPAANMKAKKDHQVPLTNRSIEILKEAKKISDLGPYVFPGGRAGKPLSNAVFLATLKRMERTDITPHGMRSSFRNWAEEKAHHFKDFIVEMSLAHSIDDKVIKAYKRTQVLDLRRELMTEWERFATGKPIAKVVRMSR